MAGQPRDNREEDSGEDESIEIEYLTKDFEDEAKSVELPPDAAEHFQFVFGRFAFVEEEEEDEEKVHEAATLLPKEVKEEEEDSEEEGKRKNAISKKKQRLKSRPTVMSLKSRCRRPEVVEVWDTTAPDPELLVWLKSYRNTVPVPPHWSQKRKYMQGKRGLNKPPFKLPEFIEATKITEIRSALQEKEAMRNSRQKQREKVRPKMHRMDIDYEVLHNAFFKYATKPPVTKFGDLYYEGKEHELKLRKYKRGILSERLIEALGIAEKAPPPWLINMQRYGPPPSCPTAKIPGLNAPIPLGAEYGYQAGGWGKPPVDNLGRPLYGDFSLETREEESEVQMHWGELGSDSEEEEVEEEVAGTQTPMPDGTASVCSTEGGHSSVYSAKTPQSLDIRNNPQQPYTLLQQHKAPQQPHALFQSSTVYKIPNAQIGGGTTPGGMLTPGMGGAITPYGATPVGQVPFVGGTITPYIAGTASIAPAGAVTPLGGTLSIGAAGGAITPQADTPVVRPKPSGGPPPQVVPAAKKKKKEFKF